MMDGATLSVVPPIPVEWVELVVEALAHRVLARVSDLNGADDRWIRGADAAAEHLDCEPGRIYALTSAKRIPHEKDGSNLMFRESVLDEFVVNGGAVRP